MQRRWQTKSEFSFLPSPYDFVEDLSDNSFQESKSFELEFEIPAASAPVVQQIFVKGKLLKCIQHWRSLGAPDFILSVIRNGYKILVISMPLPRCFTNNASALKEEYFVREAILELLRGNLVKEIISPPDIVNPLTVSVQATCNSEKRLILDLRHINLYVYKQKFKCENLHTIKNTFAKGFFVFSFDLKSGYHHVDIFPNHRKYLAFSWEFVQGHTRFFQLLLGFPVLLIFSPSFLSLWRHIGGHKAFQSPYFSMIALALVHRSKLLSPTVP